MKEMTNSNKIKRTYKVDNYFSESGYRYIFKSPYKLIAVIMIFYFVINIYSTKKEIDEINSYIESSMEYTETGNQNQINNELSEIKITSSGIKNTFDAIGGKNIYRFYCDNTGAELSGRVDDLAVIDKLIGDNIFSKSYIKKIENKESYYDFEISK